MCDGYYDGEPVAELKASPHGHMQPDAIHPDDLCKECYLAVKFYMTHWKNFILEKEEGKALEEMIPNIEEEETLINFETPVESQLVRQQEPTIKKTKKENEEESTKPADASVNLSREERIKKIREGL